MPSRSISRRDCRDLFNPVNPSLILGISAFDLRHNFVASFRYAFPFTSSKNPLHAMAVAGIARFTTRLPVTVRQRQRHVAVGTIPNGINNNGVNTPRWSGKTLHVDANPRGGAEVFDASQFAPAGAGKHGQRAPAFFSSPAWKTWMPPSRASSNSEATSSSFAPEAFNAFNHAQFSDLRRWRGLHQAVYSPTVLL